MNPRPPSGHLNLLQSDDPRLFLFCSYILVQRFLQKEEKKLKCTFSSSPTGEEYDSFADAVMLSKKAIPSYSTAEDEDKNKAPGDHPQPPSSPYGPSSLDSPRRRRAVFQLFISIIYCSLPKDC